MKKRIKAQASILAAGRVASPGKPGEERSYAVFAVDRESREIVGGFVRINGRYQPIPGLSNLN